MLEELSPNLRAIGAAEPRFPVERWILVEARFSKRLAKSVSTLTACRGARRTTDHPDPFYRRGIAELELGDFAAAVPDLERAVKSDPDYDFHRAKVTTARYYCEQVLPSARGLVPAVTAGPDVLYAVPTDALASS